MVGSDLRTTGGERRRGPGRRRERGAVLSVVSIALSGVLIAMGVAYLGAVAKAGRQARLGEIQARAHAAAEGGLTLAAAAERAAAEGAARPAHAVRTYRIGSVSVEVQVERSPRGGTTLRATARTRWGRDEAKVSLQRRLR